MEKLKLIKKFKKDYLKVHGVRCKDLTLGDWTISQLLTGINTLKFIADKRNL